MAPFEVRADKVNEMLRVMKQVVAHPIDGPPAAGLNAVPEVE